MKYRVVITPAAVEDFRRAYRYIWQAASDAAARWTKEARRRTRTLARNPQCCPLAPESATFREDIRELFYGQGNRGTYRILFAILGSNVYVLHVRHGSMDMLTRQR